MTEEQPLYKRDPAAWYAHLAEENARQAHTRVGADVLLRNDNGQILLVNPRYKPDWDLPGGIAEASEPPHLAAERNIREKLGLELPVDALLLVDWVAPQGPWDEGLMFIFDGNILTDRQAANLHLGGEELLEFRFCDAGEARTLLRPYVWRRLKEAVDAASIGVPRYLVDGSADIAAQFTPAQPTQPAKHEASREVDRGS